MNCTSHNCSGTDIRWLFEHFTTQGCHLHNFTSNPDAIQTFTKSRTALNLLTQLQLWLPLIHHTYLAFFFWEDGFTRLLLAGLIGRSLKRLNLVHGICMVDPSMPTNSSSMLLISTMPKESRDCNPEPKPSFSPVG